jgi:type I restriction enzyme M protein
MKKSLGNKRHELGDGSDGKPDHIGDITLHLKAIRSSGHS